MPKPDKSAAMIIGGGIAGMQAALDIANAGFPVYLVEREPGIGGRMAQLDKTFPTLDCASCIITPKLVDVKRNPNIHLMTCCEVTQVEGGPGDFRVTVRHKARYVDVNRCTGCAACEQVCPVTVPDQFNEKLSNQHAIYRLFPQTVPNAFAIHREGRAPCRDACPVGQRIPGYIALIREGRYQDALRTIKLDNPFPAICGRICNHRCEDVCNRAALDQAVNIRALKRFVADQVYAQERQPVEPVEAIYAEAIAIVGAGPAGLTAAQDLALAGYPVTVFEALPVAGGMLRVGVPAFRLPDEVIEREVQDILDLGIDLRLNTRVNNVESLLDDGYAAVLLAVGAHKGVRLPIEGHDLDGVLISTNFLRDARLAQFDAQGLGRVLVLGGGNVAIDCARTAVRLGAESVAMACPESYETMPAHRREIEAAEAEDIQIHNDLTFARLLGQDSRVSGVECEGVASFSFDDEGKLHVETVPDSTRTIEADTVIFAIGQQPEIDLCPEADVTARDTLAVNPQNHMTSIPSVFAAGDAITGTAFAVDAIAAGHRAAYSIHCYLRPEANSNTHIEAWNSLTAHPLPVVDPPAESNHFEPKVRMNPLERGFHELEQPFAEIEMPLTEAEALAEASRCLTCGVCAECLQCLTVCEAGAIDHQQQPWDETLDVGAIILATGFDMFDPARKPELGYGKYPNVMHALEVERLLSASGPTAGKAELKDGSAPHDVVFIQCVGSRDIQTGNPYCSRVCCMATAKEAHLLRDRLPDARITVFFMDIRAFGKNFEEFHERVRNERVIYRRGNVSEVVKGSNGKLLVKAEDTLLGKPVQVEADLVVLAGALIPRHDTRQLGQLMGLQISADGFFAEAHPKLMPCDSSRAGIFLAGVCQGPKDILDTTAHARAAAASALVMLAQTQARQSEAVASGD